MSGSSPLRKEFGVGDGEKVLLAVCNGDPATAERYKSSDGGLKAAGVREFVLGFSGGKKCTQSIRVSADMDFGKLRVGQLKELLSARGVTCGGCLEKQDYIDKLRSIIGAAS